MNMLPKSELKQGFGYLEKAVEAGRDDLDALYLLARLYAQSNEIKKEIPIYHRILERDPRHPEANYCLAMYYDQQLKDYKRAYFHLKTARDHLPADSAWRRRCDELLVQFKSQIGP